MTTMKLSKDNLLFLAALIIGMLLAPTVGNLVVDAHLHEECDRVRGERASGYPVHPPEWCADYP